MQKDRYELPKHESFNIDDVEFPYIQLDNELAKLKEPPRDDSKSELRAAMRERTQYMNRHYKNFKK